MFSRIFSRSDQAAQSTRCGIEFAGPIAVPDVALLGFCMGIRRGRGPLLAHLFHDIDGTGDCLFVWRRTGHRPGGGSSTPDSYPTRSSALLLAIRTPYSVQYSVLFSPFCVLGARRPLFTAQWSGMGPSDLRELQSRWLPPAHRRCRALRFPSLLPCASSDARASRGHEPRRHQWDDRWQWRLRTR